MRKTPHAKWPDPTLPESQLLTLFTIACFTAALSGCVSGPTARFEHRGLTDEDLASGNVFVHVSNQGMQEALALRCRIHDRTGLRQWAGEAEVRFGAHDYHTFAFKMPPGKYEIELFDGVRAKPWRMTIEVTAKRVHLDITYWLRADEGGSYRASFRGEVTDDVPVVF
jgi:hypothetical protein